MVPEIFEDPETTCLVCHKVFPNARVLKRHRRENGHYVPRAPVFHDRYIGHAAAGACGGVAAAVTAVSVRAGGGGGGGAEEGRKGRRELVVVGDKYEGPVEEGEILEVFSRVKRKRDQEDREEWEATDRDRDRDRDRQWGFAVNLNHIDHHKPARQSGRPVRHRPPPLPLPRNQQQRGDIVIDRPPALGPRPRCRPLGSSPLWKAKGDVPEAVDWDAVVHPIALGPSPCEADSRSSLDGDDDGDGGIGRLPEPCYQETIDPAEDLDVAPYRGDDEW